jgi:hypothetical protein
MEKGSEATLCDTIIHELKNGSGMIWDAVFGKSARAVHLYYSGRGFW